MKKQFLFLLFCFGMFISCSKGDKVPAYLIQPEKMGEVIWDVMRVQFLAEEKASADTSVNQEIELKRLSESVFEIHKITPKKFENSYNWYVKHPALLKAIFDSIQVQKQRQNDKSLEISDGDPNSGPVKERLQRGNKEMMETIE